jgi:putative effector of murein hydrolase LrgA (UPF0299 family)
MANARKMVVPLSLTAFVLLLLYLFVRGWVEVGEERFWILLYLFSVPVAMAVLAIWALNRHTWTVRALVGILTLVIVPVVLVQAVLLADRIYENPATFRWVLPAILSAESFFIAVFPVEPHRHERHQEKRRELQNLASTKPSSP